MFEIRRYRDKLDKIEALAQLDKLDKIDYKEGARAAPFVFFYKKHPFTCVCAFFVVHLHKFWNYEFYTPTCTLALLVARWNVQSERDSR